MTPQASTLGYLAYDGHTFPITELRLADGQLRCVAEVSSDHGELRIDQNAAVTLLDIDGQAVTYRPRIGVPDFTVVGKHSKVTITQTVTFLPE